ncbi:Cof-type HAD-IIB family hydrolase [Fusobacterium sp.]|uniref:Cof-type HAD-IIB family hydrolase n=1 Tax=Fusobacterium sp. TaxID=68766 RepID=UPI0026234863|nr:Cof-type HAD-IIB family hydrolase [Fusobacterium sp.]
MKYKAVISDLDGTLLNGEHKISEYTKNVIKNIIGQGVKFIIATGRHHIDALCFKNQLGADSYLVSANGSKVHDNDNKEIISHNISKELTERLLDIKVSSDTVRGVYLGNNWFTEKYISEFEEYHVESGFRAEVIDFENLRGKEISKIFYISDDIKGLEELEKIIKSDKEFSEKLDITASLDNCLEVMAKEATKGNAVLEILEKEGILPEEAIAFGDGLNDKEMLQVVGKGIIMGNASDKLKAFLPDYEVIGTSSEDAEAHYLEKVFK